MLTFSCLVLALSYYRGGLIMLQVEKRVILILAASTNILFSIKRISETIDLKVVNQKVRLWNIQGLLYFCSALYGIIIY